MLTGGQPEVADSPIFGFFELPALREVRFESGLNYSFEEAAASQGVSGIAGLLRRSSLSSVTSVSLEKLSLISKLINDSDVLTILRLAEYVAICLAIMISHSLSWFTTYSPFQARLYLSAKCTAYELMRYHPWTPAMGGY